MLIWRAKIVGSGAAEVSAQRLEWDGTALVQVGKTIRIFPCPTDLGKILDVGDQVWICWKSDAQRWEILSHCIEATQALATVDEVVTANPTFDAVIIRGLDGILDAATVSVRNIGLADFSIGAEIIIFFDDEVNQWVTYSTAQAGTNTDIFVKVEAADEGAFLDVQFTKYVPDDPTAINFLSPEDLEIEHETVNDLSPGGFRVKDYWRAQSAPNHSISVNQLLGHDADFGSGARTVWFGVGTGLAISGGDLIATGSTGPDELVKVNTSDPSAGFLEDKFIQLTVATFDSDQDVTISFETVAANDQIRSYWDISSTAGFTTGDKQGVWHDNDTKATAEWLSYDPLSFDFSGVVPTLIANSGRWKVNAADGLEYGEQQFEFHTSPADYNVDEDFVVSLDTNPANDFRTFIDSSETRCHSSGSKQVLFHDNDVLVKHGWATLGGGFSFSGTCPVVISVAPTGGLTAGCGIDITTSIISFKPSDVAGFGLTPGTGCSLDLLLGTCLEFQGSAVGLDLTPAAPASLGLPHIGNLTIGAAESPTLLTITLTYDILQDIKNDCGLIVGEQTTTTGFTANATIDLGACAGGGGGGTSKVRVAAADATEDFLDAKFEDFGAAVFAAGTDIAIPFETVDTGGIFALRGSIRPGTGMVRDGVTLQQMNFDVAQSASVDVVKDPVLLSAWNEDAGTLTSTFQFNEQSIENNVDLIPSRTADEGAGIPSTPAPQKIIKLKEHWISCNDAVQGVVPGNPTWPGIQPGIVSVADATDFELYLRQELGAYYIRPGIYIMPRKTTLVDREGIKIQGCGGSRIETAGQQGAATIFAASDVFPASTALFEINSTNFQLDSLGFHGRATESGSAQAFAGIEIRRVTGVVGTGKGSITNCYIQGFTHGELFAGTQNADLTSHENSMFRECDNFITLDCAQSLEITFGIVKGFDSKAGHGVNPVIFNFLQSCHCHCVVATSTADGTTLVNLGTGLNNNNAIGSLRGCRLDGNVALGKILTMLSPATGAAKFSFIDMHLDIGATMAIPAVDVDLRGSNTTLALTFDHCKGLVEVPTQGIRMRGDQAYNSLLIKNCDRLASQLLHVDSDFIHLKSRDCTLPVSSRQGFRASEELIFPQPSVTP
ncbi:MAG: hypothetical protein O7D91_21430 [Planctomycetota bacterium]|nr:hypothetical protein [Planctomycetota bacterium]